jgi:DNA-binding transcriptional MocR family regulator
VSRNTAVEAYKRFIEEGYLSTERAPDDAFAVGAPQARAPGDPRVANLPLPYTGRGPPGLHAPDHRGLLCDSPWGAPISDRSRSGLGAARSSTAWAGPRRARADTWTRRGCRTCVG